MSRLQLEVLGPPRVTVDAQPVVVTGRPLLLLLRLALGGTNPVSADRLLHDVWGPDHDDTGALRVNLTRLRHRIGDGLLVRSGRGYALTEIDLDADRMELLIAQARDRSLSPGRRLSAYDDGLQLWRGPPYADVEAFTWLEGETDRLVELREQAVDERLALRMTLEEPALLVAELTAALADQPYREVRAEMLATTLYRAHRQADALAVISAAVGRLRDDLGLEPGAGLVELEHQILSHRPELDEGPSMLRADLVADIESILRTAITLLRAGAHDAASSQIERAEAMAELVGDQRAIAECLLVRVRHAAWSGSGDAEAFLGRARHIARELRDGPLLARVAVTGFTQSAPVDLATGLVELLEPLELLPTDAPERVDLLCAGATVAAFIGGANLERGLLDMATQVHRNVGSARSAAVLAAAELIVAAGADGPDPDLEERVSAALDRAKASTDPVIAVLSGLALVRSRYVCGDLRSADELLDQVAAAGRAALIPFAPARVAICRCMHAIARGHLDEARRLTDEIDELGRRMGTRNAVVSVIGLRGLILLEDDRLDELGSLIRHHLDDTAGYRVMSTPVLALTDPDAPDPRDALTDQPTGATRLPYLGLVALAALERADADLAQWCLDELVGVGDAMLSTSLGSLMLGFPAQHTGELRRLLGDLDGSVGDLEHALELLAPTGAELWVAHTRAALAETLVLRGGDGDVDRAAALVAEVRRTGLDTVSERLAGRLRRVAARSDTGPSPAV